MNVLVYILRKFQRSGPQIEWQKTVVQKMRFQFKVPLIHLLIPIVSSVFIACFVVVTTRWQNLFRVVVLIFKVSQTRRRRRRRDWGRRPRPSICFQSVINRRTITRRITRGGRTLWFSRVGEDEPPYNGKNLALVRSFQ